MRSRPPSSRSFLSPPTRARRRAASLTPRSGTGTRASARPISTCTRASRRARRDDRFATVTPRVGSDTRPTTTVILCGGKGTRAYPHTVDVPKPLLEVAGRPVLQHVMEVYAAQGFQRFVLAAGFKAELIWKFANGLPSSWDVEVLDTGEETNTGGRILRCRDHVEDSFFATYADGLADIDLEALARFHASHGGLATLTTVPLPSQYGTLDCDDDGRVRNFREKPLLPDHWINGGFFVFDKAGFDGWEGEDL